MTAPFTPMLARLALAELSLPEVARLLAYCEGFALTIGSLGVPTVGPSDTSSSRPPHSSVVRNALRLVIEGRARWEPERTSLEAHLRTVLRAAMEDAVTREATVRGAGAGVAPALVRLSTAQLGDLDGVLKLAHRSGELNGVVRSNDRAVLAIAVELTDSVRARLADVARFDGGDAASGAANQRDVDTRRLATRSADCTPRGPL